MRLTPILALVAALAQTGCIIPGGLPPSRIDIGPSLNSTDRAAKSHLHLTVGAHVASGVYKPGLRFDAGAGYVVEHLATRPAPADEATTLKEATAPKGRYIQGAYAEGAAALPIGPRWSRTFLGGRTELLFDRYGHPGFGFIERLAWEAFTRGNSSGPIKSRCAVGGGVSEGAVAAGVFVEGGYQWLSQGERVVQVTAGLTLRLPAMGGVIIAFPWCK